MSCGVLGDELTLHVAQLAKVLADGGDVSAYFNNDY